MCTHKLNSNPNQSTLHWNPTFIAALLLRGVKEVQYCTELNLDTTNQDVGRQSGLSVRYIEAFHVQQWTLGNPSRDSSKVPQQKQKFFRLDSPLKVPKRSFL